MRIIDARGNIEVDNIKSIRAGGDRVDVNSRNSRGRGDRGLLTGAAVLGGPGRLVTKGETVLVNWSRVAAYNLISSTGWVMVAVTNKSYSAEEAVNSAEGASTASKNKERIAGGDEEVLIYSQYSDTLPRLFHRER